MKKLLSLILALLMTVTLIGCNFDDSDKDDEVEDYIKSAEKLIKKGDYEGAIEVLEEGLEETDSEEIEEMLEELEKMSGGNHFSPGGDSTVPLTPTLPAEDVYNEPSEVTESIEIIMPTEPFEPTEVIDATEAPPKTETTIICVFYYNGATTYARLADLSDPSKYLQSEEEVQQKYGTNYEQWEYRNKYGDNLVSGNQDVQHRINLFLSNFAEIHCKAYPITDFEKLNFALSHSKINNKSIVKNDTNSYYISKTDVNNTLTNFLGKTINPSEGQEFRNPLSTSPYDVITYKNGNFHYPLADGVLVDYIAVVNYMHKNPDGTYYAEYDVYYVPAGNVSDYYKIDAESAKSDGNLYYEYSGYAIVTDYTRDGGKQSYQLVNLY